MISQRLLLRAFKQNWTRSVTNSTLNLVSGQTATKSFDDIPGPKGLPLFGTALHYVVKWDGLSFDKMFENYRRRYEQFGPIYKENFGSRVIVVITDFNEYCKVMRVDGKFPERVPLDPLLTYRIRHGLDGGMVNGSGETWYNYRSSVNKKMLRLPEIISFMGCMDDAAKDFVNLISVSKDKDNIIHDLNSFLVRWSLESVNTVLLGTRLGTLKRIPDADAYQFLLNVVGVFKCMQKLFFNLPIYQIIRTPMWNKFEKHCDGVIAEGNKIVGQRMEEISNSNSQAESKTESVLSYMLANRLLKTEADIGVMLVELMLGSVETSANVLLWTLYLLSKDGKRQQTLYDEVRGVLGADESVVITPDLLNQLKYTKACIRESLRLYPVTFATSRVISEDIEVLGYKIPAGTHVQANTCTLCRDPSIFPEPDKFAPERWLAERNEDMAVSNLVWGHGPRMCIGRRIAEQEMYIALARIIYRYHLFYPSKEDPEPVLRTVITSANPLKMKFTERSCL